MPSLEQPVPGTSIIQKAFDPVSHAPITLELHVVKYIAEGGWSHVNLVEVRAADGAQHLMGRRLVWKKAVQDGTGRYDELAGHAGLVHPNMVKILAYWHDERAPDQEGEPTPRPYLSMLLTPYVPTNLESLPPPFTEHQALAFVRPLLGVLVYLATPTDTYAFVVHRDIKHQNTLVDNVGAVSGTLGVPVLCDFGAAVKVQHGQKYPSVAGDVGVRAPELLAASPGLMTYTPKIDVYGLGLMLAYLLLGRELYGRIMPEGKQDPALQLAEIRRVLGGEGGERVALTTLFKGEKLDVSEHVVELLAGLLAIDPDKRLSANEAATHPAFLT